MLKKIIISFSLALLLVTACKHEPAIVEVKSVQVSIDSLKFVSIADTIINDMVVKNPDTSDAWMEAALGDLNRKEFVETIFNDVYNQKLIAYDYFTGKELSVQEVKSIEKAENYTRDIIGKFQFKETWLYDKENHAFVKKVHSIVFGYETYEEMGNVKGYKPLFMVKF